MDLFLESIEGESFESLYESSNNCKFRSNVNIARISIFKKYFSLSKGMSILQKGDFHSKMIELTHLNSKIDMINVHSKINSKLLIQDKNIQKKFSNFKNKNKFLDDFIKYHKFSIERKNFNSFLIKTNLKNYHINTINNFMIKKIGRAHV